MSVLITDAEQKQALAITQSLGKKGIAVSCLSSNPSAPSFYSKYCKDKFVSPNLTNKDRYINFLLDIVKTKKYEILITCSDSATEYISEIRDSLYPYVTFLLPEHKTVIRVLNKDELMKFCIKKNLAVPKTEFPKSAEDVVNLNGKFDYPIFDYPIVLKGTRGAAANNVRYANSKYELVSKYLELKAKAPEVIIQEYIPGSNYDFYALCDKGQIIAYFMFKTLRAYPVTGGTPGKAISVYDVKLKEFAAKIVGELNYSGIINLDFIKDERDYEYKLLEFNPRFGGTTPLAISCGVDLPFLLYEYVIMGKKESVKTYKVNKVFRSLFKEEILYAVNRPKDIPWLLLEFLNPTIDYGIQLSDPAPLIGLMKQAKMELIYKFRAKLAK